MARKKKADIMLHNDKKMETVLDFGNIKVPTKWEEVTLQMLSDYLTLSHEKEEALKNLRGQMLDVMVLYVNKDRLQVTVSNVMAMKKQYRLAKEAAYAALAVDMVVEGEVVNVLPYGAIVSLGEVSGLLHQSESLWSIQNSFSEE